MATIRKRGDKWQVRIQRRGVPEQSKTFLSRVDAEKWARSIEAEIDRGVYVSIKKAEPTTLAMYYYGTPRKFHRPSGVPRTT